MAARAKIARQSLNDLVREEKEKRDAQRNKYMPLASQLGLDEKGLRRLMVALRMGGVDPYRSIAEGSALSAYLEKTEGIYAERNKEVLEFALKKLESGGDLTYIDIALHIRERFVRGIEHGRLIDSTKAAARTVQFYFKARFFEYKDRIETAQQATEKK